METEQLKKIWISKFGDEYTRRKLLVHEKEGEARKAFWSMLFNVLPDVKSVIEIGCNAGMNLEAIYKYNSTLEIRGIEPNKNALKKAHERFSLRRQADNTEKLYEEILQASRIWH